jgi:hypothetical protein
MLTMNTAQSPIDGGPLVYSTLEIITLQTSDPTFDFSLSVTASPSIGGTYSCTPTPTSNVEIVYDDIGVFTTTMASCTVSITLSASGDGGLEASGTFSAVLTVSDGGTKMLTNGTFHFPVTSG